MTDPIHRCLSSLILLASQISTGALLVISTGCSDSSSTVEHQENANPPSERAPTVESPQGSGGDASAPVPQPSDPELCPYYEPNCADEPSSGGGTASPIPEESEWELIWQDDFDTFDEDRWRRHDHTFPENAAYFSYDNVAIEDGKLVLRLTQNPSFNPSNEWDKPYLGGEISTAELFEHVRITARIKFASGQGVISSLFTFADDAATFWNEIDIEHLGYSPESIQYNLITSNCPTCGGDRSYTPYPDAIGVDPSLDFHVYEITWRPDGVAFRIDELPTRWQHHDPAMTAAMRIRMNIWPTSELDPFAGTLDPNAIPTQAEYDWIRVERYVGE